MTFKNNRYFKGLCLIENYKTEVIYDEPIYVGTSILDLSKLLNLSKIQVRYSRRSIRNKYKQI